MTKETKINMNGNSTNNIHNNHTNNNHPPPDHDYGSGPKRLKSNDGGVVESPPREGNFGSQNSSSGLGDKKNAQVPRCNYLYTIFYQKNLTTSVIFLINRLKYHLSKEQKGNNIHFSHVFGAE